MKGSRLLFTLFLIAFLMGSGACAAEPTFIFARGADAVRLDPATITDNESINSCNQIFETLVRFSKDGKKIEPLLAKSWEFEESDNTWTFHLRENVQFHDGTPFNADAVVFSLMRQKDPAHPYAVANAAFWKSSFSQVEEIKKIDDTTVSVKLSSSYAPFLSLMANNLAMIISPAAMQKSGADGFNLDPVGTGPYRLEEWKKNEQVVLKEFEGYWGQKPSTPRVIIRSIPDNTARVMALLAGEIHGMDGVTPDTIKILQDKKAAGIKMLSAPGLNTGFMAMNTQKKPFDDVRVRRAVAHAVNMERIIKETYRGMGSLAKGLVPPTLWGYNASLKPYEYDPEKSKALLAEAGLPNGFETELWYMPVPRIYLPDCKLVAQIIQGDLAKVGINVKLLTYDWGTYVEKAMKFEHTMCFLGRTADYIDPDAFMYGPFVTGSIFNFPNWSDTEFDTLVIEARKIADQEKRVALYEKAQDRVNDQVPMVTIAHGNNVVLLRKEVEGFYLHPTAQFWFHEVSVKQ